MMSRLNQVGVVVRNPPRADEDVVAQLKSFGVATIHEAMGRVGLLSPAIRPVYVGAKVCGTALTVLAQPGDNWMLHVAAEQVRAGDVVVVACTTENIDGMFGDLLATSFRARGAVGLISDTGVRDVSELAQMNFPVFARAIHAKGTVKATLGSVNIPIVCAGALIHPGDVIVGDADGVVVVPRETAPQVVQACIAREAKEAKNRAQFAAGELGLDIYGMRDALAKAGLTYVDAKEKS
jgi:4-hydroxy-4-methyl-2-oxoglutarate aldolase